jgi:polyisoprenoid-binding protein YceI
MKITTTHHCLFAAACCFMAAAVSVRAADVTHYRARPLGNIVHIDGAANVHNWEMEGTIIGGTFDVPSAVVLDSTQAAVAGVPADGKINAVADVSIPVTSILNSKFNGMSEVMQQAMDAPNSPDIKFHLTDMTLKQPHTANTPLQLDTKGDLTIKGVTKKVSFPITIENGDKGKLKISASNIPINMPDYSVTPPTKAGLFVTEPGVKISFTWVVGLAAKPAAAK